MITETFRTKAEDKIGADGAVPGRGAIGVSWRQGSREQSIGVQLMASPVINLLMYGHVRTTRNISQKL